MAAPDQAGPVGPGKRLIIRIKAGFTGEPAGGSAAPPEKGCLARPLLPRRAPSRSNAPCPTLSMTLRPNIGKHQTAGNAESGNRGYLTYVIDIGNTRR